MRTAECALDTNTLISALDKGELAAVDKALAGRAPVLSIRAAREYLRKGDIINLRGFLTARGGRMASAATAVEIANLQVRARSLGRVLHYADAEVAASAVREGIPLMTRDARLHSFLRAAGLQVELY